MNTLYKFLITILLSLCCFASHAQFVDGTKGLLCKPSAEFEEDATFTITNNYLRKEYLPETGWGYDTFGYTFSVTLWSRLEIAYVCTIFDGKRKPNPSYRDKIMFNQDRHFAARVAITKDGEWGQKWLPAIAIGLSDPVTGSGGGNYIGSDITGNSGNGFFNRYYIAMAKNFGTPWGNVGAHLAYQYSQYRNSHFNGPCAAVTWSPVWLNREEWFMNKFTVTAEYDAHYVNLGVNASIWKDRFEIMAMLLGCRYPMVGVRFKLALSH